MKCKIQCFVFGWGFKWINRCSCREVWAVPIFGNKHFGDAKDYSCYSRIHKGCCLIKRNSVYSGSQDGRSSALWRICNFLTTLRHTVEDKNLQRNFSDIQTNSSKFNEEISFLKLFRFPVLMFTNTSYLEQRDLTHSTLRKNKRGTVHIFPPLISNQSTSYSL